MPADATATATETMPEKIASAISEYDLGDTSMAALNPPEPEKKPDPKPAQATAPAPAPTEPKPQAAEPPAPKHSARVLRMAKDFGIADAVIKGTTPEALDELVYDLHSRSLAEAREANRAGALRGASERGPSSTAPGPGSTPVPRPGTPPAEDAIDWGEETLPDGKKVKFTEDEIAPAIVHVVRSLKREITELKGKLTATEQREQERQFSSVADEADGAFDSLGGIFGKGTRHDLTPGSAEHTLRLALLADLQATPPSEKRVRDAIVARARAKYPSLFPAGAETPHPAAPAKPLPPRAQDGTFTRPAAAGATAEDYEAAGLARPTQRNGKAEKGARAAEQAAANWMNNNGYDPETIEKTELDGFLG
jgi:hypothetical protein